MRSYSAYSLTLQSEIPLPELPGAEADPDIVLTKGYVPTLPSRVDEDGHGFWCTADEACHYFAKVGGFLVRGGREIVVDADPAADPALVRLSILGPALGLALHQRGHLVLHASSVSIDGRAVLFLGWRGWGKSTLAAVLHGRGYPVISDDVTALVLKDGPPAVLPGVPQLKLWPDAVTAMGDAPEDLPRLHPDFEKRALRVAEDFPMQPVPLARIHVLAAGPKSEVAPLGPTESVLELIRHWYCSRFGDQLLRIGTTAAEHLRQCGALTRGVEVRRLSRPRLTWSAETLADLVEADLAG
ncbi:MAG: hypothetical protein PVH00_02295 [Gemmatimonadota bacterium]